jgi:hypothetical protein
MSLDKLSIAREYGGLFLLFCKERVNSSFMVSKRFLSAQLHCVLAHRHVTSGSVTCDVCMHVCLCVYMVCAHLYQPCNECIHTGHVISGRDQWSWSVVVISGSWSVARGHWLVISGSWSVARDQWLVITRLVAMSVCTLGTWSVAQWATMWLCAREYACAYHTIIYTQTCTRTQIVNTHRN